jgi:hypothetical protein
VSIKLSVEQSSRPNDSSFSLETLTGSEMWGAWLIRRMLVYFTTLKINYSYVTNKERSIYRGTQHVIPPITRNRLQGLLDTGTRYTSVKRERFINLLQIFYVLNISKACKNELA